MNEIVAKIDKLEYTRVTNLEKEVNSLKVKLERNNVLTTNNMQIMEKFSNTLECVKDTMVEISANTKANSDMMKQLHKKVDTVDNKVEKVKDEMSERIDETEKKMEVNENKNKIDTREIIKRIIVDVLIGGGTALLIHGIIQSSVK